MQVPQPVRELLAKHRQEHLLSGWESLSESQQRSLVDQIADVDFDLIQRLFELRSGKRSDPDSAARADRAQPPDPLIRRPRSANETAEWKAATATGEELLQQGKVACILVAGGQGTRLGFDPPKGMYPIGPVSERTLFDWLCGQVAARGRRAGRAIPYLIMTSEATDADTRAYFHERGNLGLAADQVFFFRQRSLPAVDDEAPRLLLDRPGRLSTSPDGHGGMLHALHASGLLKQMADRGVEHFYYHQVDNPTAIVCEPAFLGFHLQRGADVTTKVVRKVSAEEKMGVVAAVDGRCEIMEYSDLSDAQKQATMPDGSLKLWAGNTAIHVFRVGFLRELIDRGIELPFHVAHKPVPYLDETGRRVEPGPKENTAHKFEQFIFDVLPQAQAALVIEGDRAREFNPVKNKSGNDSPETCRAAMLRIHRDWLTAAGAQIAPDARVEIGPEFAIDAEEAAGKVQPGQSFTGDIVL